MSAHTPGPWRVANSVQIRSQRDQIAKVWMMRNGEGNANARLIAAAPDMLKALQRLTRPIPDDENMGHALDDIRNGLEVIARATGESI